MLLRRSLALAAVVSSFVLAGAPRGIVTAASAAEAARPASSAAPTAAPTFGAAPTNEPSDPGRGATPAPHPLGSAAPAGPPTAAPAGPNVPSAAALGALQGAFGALQSARSAPQPYAAFIRGTTREPGAIDIVTKDDEVYFDLSPEQLGKTFIVAPMLASGLAGEPAFTGRTYPTFMLTFQRVGKRLLWVTPNDSFTAPADSAAARSLAISVADSVINSTPIVAEDEATHRVVISAGYFLTDFENVGRDLAGRGAPSLLIFGGAPRAAYAVDPTRSYLERVKGFPKNDEMLANLAFAGAGSTDPAIADPRGVRVRMHYSIVEAPRLGTYVPRLADDRVGYFVETHKRFGDDARPTPYVRYVIRRDLSQPVVYYLTDEIPEQYRASVRAGVLAWNRAFAKIGIPNAIEVRDQPSDPNFDPDDVRYSTIRWISADRSSFVGYGTPFEDDPRTGQILRSTVVIDGETLRDVRRGYTEQIRPIRASKTADAACNDGTCEADGDEAVLAATGTLALRAGGASAAQRERYVQDYVRSVIMHEIGHTLGLRHNFASSTLYTLAQLHDKAFTQQHGLSSSVMGYLPPNVSPHGIAQADYFEPHVGPYDEWAIRYGYERIPEAKNPDEEHALLGTIASESTRPEYLYLTDEDTNGPQGIDPRANVFSLSNDPLAYSRQQFSIGENLIANLDRLLPRDGGTYADERAALTSTLRGYVRAADVAAKYLGGVYTSRSHRGQAGGQAPLRLVHRETSRRAFDLLDRYVLSERALRFSPRLLSHLGYDHFGGWGNGAARPDYPVTELVAAVQDSIVLDTLLSPETASRIAESELRQTRRGETMSLEDLFGWTQDAIFADVHPGATAAGPVRRSLQRRYALALVDLALAPSFLVSGVGYPDAVPGLARYELQRLVPQLERSLHGPGLDVATRAQREDLLDRIRRALAPTTVRGA